MNKLEIKYMSVNDIIPYENNPRKNEDAVEYVANSIKEFGFKVPIIIDKENVIVTGHTRLKAAEKLGLKEVPVILADDLSEEQIKAFRLADNKVSEFSMWDFDKLNIELSDLDFNMQEFGFNLDIDDISNYDEENEENPYTTKINIPQYEIRGDEPAISELVDTTKTETLINKIKKSNCTEEQKNFLIEAAQRHLGFNYSKIAEYYAHQEKEMQELMEESALVIIDYDDAIKNGYAELVKGIELNTDNEEEIYDE